MINNILDALLDNFDHHFMGVLSKSFHWRAFIERTEDVNNQYECAALCKMDTLKKCSYFVFESNNCHLGNLDALRSILTPTGKDEVVYFLNSTNSQKFLSKKI